MSESTTRQRMSRLRVGTLVVYLVFATALSAHCVWGLWGAVPSMAESDPDGLPDLTITPPTEKTPQILHIDPSRIAYGAGRPVIRVFGHHFTDGSEVEFDGDPRPTDFVNSNQLLVRLGAADFTRPGIVVLKVKEGDQESNSDTLLIVAAQERVAVWQPFFLEFAVSLETRLLLLVLFTGAFGASVMGLQSIADYRGQDKLHDSWTVFYLVRPMIGAGVAFVFFLVIRGGFLAGTDVDLGVATPFGIIAVAALTGMFSDKAVLKLNEVFLTLFKSDDRRGQKLGVPAPLAITTQSLGDGNSGQVYGPVTLTASGGVAPYTWTAVTPLPAGLQLDSDSGVIAGTPAAVTPKKKYQFNVKDTTGQSATAKLDWEIK